MGKMKLSNLVLIFAAVTEARKVDVGSRWEKKQGFVAAKQEKAENKAENKQAAAQEKKENKIAAKQVQKSMRSLAVGGKPSGQRRQARKHLILSRQEGRAEARKEALFIKKSERAENSAERKDERNENRIAAINARQEARAERGPRPEGERRENRMDKLAEVKAKYAAKKAARQKAIQLAKTWKPCGADGSVSNMPWGDRKPGHMQLCMKSRGYQYDSMRCMIYGMRADHVDEACRSTCDQILADYDNLNVDMAECAASKQ